MCEVSEESLKHVHWGGFKRNVITLMSGTNLYAIAAPYQQIRMICTLVLDQKLGLSITTI
jgi:hypothetical protein